jgi:DNA-nicking Smr family endonuclease
MAASSTDRPLLNDLQQLKQQLSLKQRLADAERRAAEAAQAAREAERIAHSPDLFRQAMQGVQPLVQHTTPIRAQRPPKPNAQTLARRAAATGLHDANDVGLSDTQAFLNPVASEARLSYRQATLQHRIFDQLQQGKMRWYEAVDLHGCTLEQARVAVLQLIDLAQTANQTVVKIVHGKGPNAIIKTAVNGWLRQHRDVMAFVSAPSDQGGTGAVLVLLKRADRPSTST